MEIDSRHREILIRFTEHTFKSTVHTPTDFDLLATDIFRRTGHTIGVSTLKRIWGYVSAPHGTSFSTLTTLSRYCGYADWDVFCRVAPGDDDKLTVTSGFDKNSIVACHLLELNTVLQIRWLPDKLCRLKKIAQPDLFRVVESRNIKLLPGDIGHVNSLRLKTSLIMTGCRRDVIPLGNYHGASKGGIEEIEIVE